MREACRADPDVAPQVAADLGNTALGVLCVSSCRGDNQSGDVPIPPVEKFCRCFLCFWCCVSFKKVNNEFIEFLITESIVVTVPVSCVCKVEVKLREV